MLLAGDVGGTKTLLGLFEATGKRPTPLAVRTFSTLEHPNLIAMIESFMAETPAAGARLDAASFGVAGPVVEGAADLTNVPWRVDAAAVGEAFRIPRVALLNDLEAMACAVPVLDDHEIHTLQQGAARAGGNMAVVAAGTGLGEALLHNVGGRFIPSPCEGGHADFAARNEREIEVLRDLTRRFGRASVEHVLSGRGLENVHRVTHGRPAEGAVPPCPAGDDAARPPAAAEISEAALSGRCPACVEALEIFVDVYGAEAGNHALRSMSTAGLFIGGGIAPKILPALTTGRFMQAFLAKPPHVELLAAMPVKIILNADAGLLGAAVFAAGM
jgi:glucokinase